MSALANPAPALVVSGSRLPAWFKQPVPDAGKIHMLKSMFRHGGLHTVCESAHCPNMGQCWGQGVATFMILGELCTRSCRFCAVRAGKPSQPDPQEPRQVALAVQKLKLRYVVITSVARDDLHDQGSGQFSRTIRAIRSLLPMTKIEVLVPDFSNRPESLKAVIEAGPDVIAQNQETVRRLSPTVRPQADYDRTLEVLRKYKNSAPGIFIKSGLMAGLGETPEEMKEAIRDLKSAGCEILTIGQYLAPSTAKRHLPVAEFVSPDRFKDYERFGYELGLKHIMSDPLVRSSYIAEQGYAGCLAASPRSA